MKRIHRDYTKLIFDKLDNINRILDNINHILDNFYSTLSAFILNEHKDKHAIDVEMLKHPAFRKNILKKRDVIYRQFGEIVDSKFKTVDKFKLFLKRFKVLAARAHKKRDLNAEEQAQYAKLKIFIRNIFKIGP